MIAQRWIVLVGFLVTNLLYCPPDRSRASVIQSTLVRNRRLPYSPEELRADRPLPAHEYLSRTTQIQSCAEKKLALQPRPLHEYLPRTTRIQSYAEKKLALQPRPLTVYDLIWSWWS